MQILITTVRIRSEDELRDGGHARFYLVQDVLRAMGYRSWDAKRQPDLSSGEEIARLCDQASELSLPVGTGQFVFSRRDYYEQIQITLNSRSVRIREKLNNVFKKWDDKIESDRGWYTFKEGDYHVTMVSTPTK